MGLCYVRQLLYFLSFHLCWRLSSLFIGWGSSRSSRRLSIVYLALFTTMVWSIVAERQDVSSIAKVTAENTGIRASFAACGITFVANLIALFFVHQLRYSRAFIVLSTIFLLVSDCFSAHAGTDSVADSWRAPLGGQRCSSWERAGLRRRRPRGFSTMSSFAPPLWVYPVARRRDSRDQRVRSSTGPNGGH